MMRILVLPLISENYHMYVETYFANQGAEAF